MSLHDETHTKKAYHAPQLRTVGSLSDQTLGSGGESPCLYDSPDPYAGS